VSDRVAVRLTIHGRVQGVGFRWHLQRQASAAGLDGWCRNRCDGSVETLLAGAPGAVERVQAWCGQGPAWAEVDEVEVDHEVADPGQTGFRIRD
jgi:acylphosphatase